MTNERLEEIKKLHAFQDKHSTQFEMVRDLLEALRVATNELNGLLNKEKPTHE